MTGKRIRHRTKKGVLLKFGFVLYFIFCLFATISLRTAVFNMEYELGALEDRRADLISEQRMILAKRASFTSVENVESVAIKRLGMDLPERTRVFYVKSSELAGPRTVSNEVRR